MRTMKLRDPAQTKKAVAGMQPVLKRFEFRAQATLARLFDVILFCLGMGLAANAAAVLAPVQADASIDSIAPKTNYGNDTKLQIGGSKNPPTDYRQTLLKFDLSLLPNGTAGAD